VCWMILGFGIARRLPVWATVALALAFELLTLIVIRDNLFLNVLMLVWPVDGSDVIDYDPDRRHLYTSGQVSASLAIVGVSSAGHMAVLGEDDAALGSHCVVGDGQGGVYLCDPDGGRILVRDDPFDPITE